MASMNSPPGLRWLGRARKELRRINRIKAVLGTTKITTHLNLPLLGQNALNLFRTQAADHATHTLAAA